MKKLLALVFLLQSTFPAISQDDFSLQFDHVALSVKNLDESTAFYVDILNLKEITNRTQNPGIRWFSLGEGKELHLVSTVPGEVKINKAVHFALTTENYDAFVDRLKANKIAYQSWPGILNKISVRPDGIRQVYIRDPDGYWIEVNSVNNRVGDLPDPVEAKWKGQEVCKVIEENEELRTLKCIFPPGVGHDKHFHAKHYGYTLKGSAFKITDAEGTREVNVTTGSDFFNSAMNWHEVENIGDSTAVFLIMEIK
ncbi:MAG: VOC family protein [Bacteroidota bacterium]